MAAAGEHCNRRRRPRARQDISAVVSCARSAGGGKRSRGVPRYRLLVEAPTRRCRSRALRVRVRLVAVRAVPADLPYYGFNSDEQNRLVYDGVMAHIAGAGRISINERGANPNAASASNITNFPFTNVSSRDPNSGRSEGLLDNDRARQNQPKIFFTNSGVEYWNTRAAALTHTTPDGRTDVAPPDTTRIYFLTGTQHSPGQFPPRRTTGQQLDNPVQDRWTFVPCSSPWMAGCGGHAASSEPISEVERRHAGSPRNSRVPGNSWRSVAADSSACTAGLYSPSVPGATGR